MSNDPPHDALYYEHIGENFERWMSDYDVQRRLRLIDRLWPRVDGIAQALEVGCGTGRISRALIGRVQRLTVTDISGELARQVGESLGCGWSQADACALPLPRGQFDLVVSSECIEHTPHPWKALEEMARVLKPDGCLIVTTPNRLWYPLIAIASALKLRRFNGTENWLWPESVRRWLSARDMRQIHMDGCHLFPWQLPLAKRVLPLFEPKGGVLYPLMINFGFSARSSGAPREVGDERGRKPGAS